MMIIPLFTEVFIDPKWLFGISSINGMFEIMIVHDIALPENAPFGPFFPIKLGPWKPEKGSAIISWNGGVGWSWWS